MENQKKVCPICSVDFSTVSSKNRHLRIIHKVNNTPISKKCFIKCPLCKPTEVKCGTYKKLETHLSLDHEIKLEFQTYHFTNEENYEQWFKTRKLDMIYAVYGVKKCEDYTLKSYVCNRSNSRGFESKSSRRRGKLSGSIKIHGVCPSRIETRILQTGQTMTRFWKTHVGHEENIGKQHLSRVDKKEIVPKLCDGVTVERIISDTRKKESEDVQRLHLIDKIEKIYRICQESII